MWKRIVQIGAVTLFSLAVMAWARGQIRSGIAIAEWDREWRDSRTGILEGNLPPQTVNHALLFARFLQRELFPPHYQDAVALLTNWITLDPWRSSLWMELARGQFFRKNPERAKASLEWADELDPHFPRQRAESIQLWALLGDNERAMAIGEAVGRFGGDFRLETAKALRQSNVASPSVIFDKLSDPDITAAAAVDLISVLQTGDTSQMVRMYDALPEATRKDPAFRNQAAPEFGNPVVVETVLTEMWRQAGAAGDPILTLDSDLRTPPFASGFWLGWQPAPNTNDFRVAWNRGAGPGDDGAGAIEIRPSAPGGRRKKVVWPFYRLLLPAGSDDVTLGIQLRSIPPGPSRGILVVVGARGTAVSRGDVVMDSDDWQPINVTVPKSDTPRVLLLHIQIEPAKNTHLDNVLLGGLSVQPALAVEADSVNE